MVTLGIDSSSGAGSAAIQKDGKLLSEVYRNVGLTHSETLAPTVEKALQEAGLTPADIDCIAVSCGPGSFTGIRIGVALAKGMAFPGGIPTVGALSTEALAWPYRDYPGLVAAVLDARRNRVFLGLYLKGQLRRELEVVDVAALPELLAGQNTPPMLVGDGADMCYNQLKEQLPLAVAPAALREIRASAVAEIGEAEFLAGRAVKAADLRPVYVQMSQAERTLKEKNNKN